MAPPVEKNTKRRTFARRQAWIRLRLPMTLTWASKTGSSTERGTLIWAARWNTASGFSRSITRGSQRVSTSIW